METDLVEALKTLCARTFPDVAPAGTVLPYVVWQGLGGTALRYGDGAPTDRRNTYLQVAVWAATRAEALGLIRQIEDVLCASPAFTVIAPESEARSVYEPDTQRYGSIQRFDIWAGR